MQTRSAGRRFKLTAIIAVVLSTAPLAAQEKPLRAVIDAEVSAARQREKVKPVVKGWVFGLAISPDSRLALVAERFPLVFTPADHHRGVKLWDVEKREVKHDLSAQHKVYIGGAAFSPDGQLLVLAQGNETGNGKAVREFPGHAPGGVHDVRYSVDGRYIFSCGRDTLVRVWNVEDGKQLAEVGKPRGGQFKDIWHALSLSTDQQWLAATDMSGQVVVYKA